MSTATTAVAATSSATTTSTKAEDPTIILSQRLAENIGLIKKGVEFHDDSFILRALRRTTLLRKSTATKNTNGNVMKSLIVKYLSSVTSPSPGEVNQLKDSLTSLFPNSMEIVLDETPSAAATGGDVTMTTSTTEDATAAVSSSGKKQAENDVLLPEVELYLHHTAIHIAKTYKTCSAGTLMQSAKAMIGRARKFDSRRTLDILKARAWHTFAMTFELANGKLDDACRDEILQAHRLACLRLDEVGQAVTINLILRDLVARNLVSEAAKFASKAHFPDRVSNNQQVRHLYYMGRVEALQLEYGKSLSLIQQAIRKTPTTCGRGFRLKLYELATVVTLLTGETPERGWFSDKELGEALLPYFDLVKAVRVGHVHAFETCIKAHALRYEKDNTLTLVQRLHSSVIKTGLRDIGAAYSRISFSDIAAKLELEGEDANAQTAFYLCAKAIRDGVLDATIDSDGGWLMSSDQVDIYSSTSDPQRAYQRRINFLLQVHNDAVKSLRFPPDAHKTQNRPATSAERSEDAELEDLDDNLAGDED